MLQPSDVGGLHKKYEDPVMSEEGKVFQAVSYEGSSGLIKFLISAHFPSLLFILSQSFPLGQSLDGALDLHCLHPAHDTGPAKGFTWKREPQTSNPELGVVINRPTWTCWVANWEKRNISSRKNSNGTEMEVNPSECLEMSAMLTQHVILILLWWDTYLMLIGTNELIGRILPNGLGDAYVRSPKSR